MWHVWGTVVVCTGFWWGNLRERDHLENPGVDEMDNIRMNLQEMGCEGTDLIDWFRRGTGGGHL